MVYIKSNWGLQPAASSQHQTSIGEWKVFRWFQSSAFGSSGWGSVHNGVEKVISVVLCVNFWPIESVSNINDCFIPHCGGNLLWSHSNMKSTSISLFQMIQNELYWQILRWLGIIYSLVAQSVLAWKIPGMGVPGGLLSMGSHRFRHDWSDLAAAAAAALGAWNLNHWITREGPRMTFWYQLSTCWPSGLDKPFCLSQTAIFLYKI